MGTEFPLPALLIFSIFPKLAIPRPTRLGSLATSNLLIRWLDWLFNHLTGIVEIGIVAGLESETESY
jgi:hypothetical protein